MICTQEIESMKVRPSLIGGRKRRRVTYQGNQTRTDQPATVFKTPLIYAYPLRIDKPFVVYGWLHFDESQNFGGEMLWLYATGYLFVQSGILSPVYFESKCYVYAMASNWDPNTLCWNNQPAFTGNPMIHHAKLYSDSGGLGAVNTMFATQSRFEPVGLGSIYGFAIKMEMPVLGAQVTDLTHFALSIATDQSSGIYNVFPV